MKKMFVIFLSYTLFLIAEPFEIYKVRENSFYAVAVEPGIIPELDSLTALSFQQISIFRKNFSDWSGLIKNTVIFKGVDDQKIVEVPDILSRFDKGLTLRLDNLGAQKFEEILELFRNNAKIGVYLKNSYTTDKFGIISTENFSEFEYVITGQKISE